MSVRQFSFVPPILVWAMVPDAAQAHAAEQGFVLLLPTDAYITAGTLTVALSMVLLAVLRGVNIGPLFAPRRLPLPRIGGGMEAIGSALGAAVFAFLIWTGFFGPSDPQSNLMPLVVWTVWWMALFIVQGLVLDIWRWINPFAGLHQLVQPAEGGMLNLPAGLSIWPAVLIFAAFQGFVLADVAPNDPDRLAAFALGYWIFTHIGMTVFGRASWLAQVECFTVLFRLIGLLRPLQSANGLQIGFPGWALLQGRRPDLSHASFVLILLAGGSFDGLHETFWWLAQIGVNPLEFPGRSVVMWNTIGGLYGSIALLAVVFAGAVWLGLRLCPTGSAPPFAPTFVSFAMTLLPIALGYHFAHYFVTFLIQIQYTAANLADPFAAGWNLFGLGEMRIRTGFIAQPDTVRRIWLTQAGGVVLSHVLAVVLCHRSAEILCTDRKSLLWSQFGIAVLMILYTVFGLWLLASPRGA